MRILDRYILVNFLVSYLIVAFVLVGLYVLVDLTLASDEFTEESPGAGAVLARIGNYYGHQMFVYFRDLAGMITLLSAVVTLTTMNRRNEMTAILASGVSLYRVIWPVVLLGVLFNLLGMADQELVLPGMADQLVRAHDEQSTMKKFPLWFYRLHGAWSSDDRCRVKFATDPTGNRLAPGAADGVLRVVADRDDAPPAGPVNAVRQMRKDDLLAVHVGQGPEVRVYVRVRTDSPDLPAPDAEAIPVILAGVAQTGYGELPPAREPALERIARGDRVTFVHPPVYQVTAIAFHPDPGEYRMENVAVIKSHARTSLLLARINAASAYWQPEANAWVLRDDLPAAAGLAPGQNARIVFLAPPQPGQEHLPNKAEPVEASPIHTDVSPREIVLEHSSRGWMQFMSTTDLKRLSESRSASSADRARAIMHLRFTQPIINVVLLLLGVPFVLSRSPVGLWEGMMRCVLISGSCFVVSFVCQQISGDARGWAVVAAWLPVILFGPLAVLMLDSVKT